MPELSIHADRCVHQRVRDAACQACVDACPPHAWRMDDEGLAFDPDRCDACGLCTATCPTQALSLPAPTPLWRDHGAGHRTAWWSCERAGVPGTATAPCLLALAPAWLHAFSRQHDVRQHVFVPGTCSACDRGRGLGEWQRQWRGLATRQAVALRIAPAADWPRPDAAVDAGRRRFFLTRAPARPRPAPTRLTSAREDELGRAPAPDGNTPNHAAHAPLWTLEITRERCTLCLACVRLCPTQALSLTVADTDPADAQFGLDAQKCTGCGLCTAACDVRAVSAPRAGDIDHATNAPDSGAAQRWAVRRQRCVRCNIDFHQFCDAGADPHWPQVCPTCAPGSRQRPNRVVQTPSTP